MSQRIVMCGFYRGSSVTVERPELSIEQRNLLPWIDRWTPGDGRKIWVDVTLMRDGRLAREVVDAREWIESLHDEQRWPAGTVFELVTEATS